MNYNNSIGDLQSRISEAFSYLWRLRREGNLPSSLEALAQLAPAEESALAVSLCHAAESQANGKDRQIRRDADARSNWGARPGLAIRLTYVQVQNPRNERFETVVAIVRKAEGRLPFVGLKHLRDTLLPASGAAWASSPANCGTAVKEAIQAGVLVTEKVPNPKNADHPTTAVKVAIPASRTKAGSPATSIGFLTKVAKRRGDPDAEAPRQGIRSRGCVGPARWHRTRREQRTR